MYSEVLPEAIRYGMSQKDFWHGDMRLLSAAQKAYFRDRSYSAWVNGQYSFVAYQYAIHNAMRANAREKYFEYPEWTDPFERKQVVTKETMEQRFRINMRRLSEKVNNF